MSVNTARSGNEEVTVSRGDDTCSTEDGGRRTGDAFILLFSSQNTYTFGFYFYNNENIISDIVHAIVDAPLIWNNKIRPIL